MVKLFSFKFSLIGHKVSDNPRALKVDPMKSIDKLNY